MGHLPEWQRRRFQDRAKAKRQPPELFAPLFPAEQPPDGVPDAERAEQDTARLEERGLRRPVLDDDPRRADQRAPKRLTGKDVEVEPEHGPP